MQQSRRLVLIRHARAEPNGPTDLERPLTTRGAEDAAAAGTWLADTGVQPDHAVVSAALRARQTWSALVAQARWALEPDVSDGLYTAEPDTVLDLLREVPVGAGCVVVVGHNPTVATLAQMLDDGNGDPDAGIEMTTGGFPPCSLAVFDHDGEWAELELASARLTAFRVARGVTPGERES